MSYHIDLRKQVVEFIRDGGQQKDAVRIFNVSRRTIYTWLQRSDLSPTVRGPRKHKLNRDKLKAHIRAFPDALLRERAKHFNVSKSTVGTALKKLDIRKKNSSVILKETT
jgi:transposase